MFKGRINQIHKWLWLCWAQHYIKCVCFCIIKRRFLSQKTISRLHPGQSSTIGWKAKHLSWQYGIVKNFLALHMPKLKMLLSLWNKEISYPTEEMVFDNCQGKEGRNFQENQRKNWSSVWLCGKQWRAVWTQKGWHWQLC